MADHEAFLQEVQDGLSEVLRPYQQRLNRRQRMGDFVRLCIRCAGRNDFIQLDELLKSTMAEDVQKEAGLKAVKALLDQLRTYADEQVTRYRVDFIEDLTAQAKEADLPMTVDFPRFTVLKGIEGEVEFGARRTVINKKPLKSIDPRRIVAAARRVKQQLYDRPYDPQAFIDGLYKVYTEVLDIQGDAPGAATPVQPVYKAYVLSRQSRTFFQDMDKGKFRGYSLDQFSVDMWRYFQSGIGGTSGGCALELRSGRNNALWLIDSDGERRQITRISFHKAERKGRKK